MPQSESEDLMLSVDALCQGEDAIDVVAALTFLLPKYAKAMFKGDATKAESYLNLVMTAMF